MVDTSILQHHTAGLEEQLGCSGTVLVSIAYLSAVIAAFKLLISPRLNSRVSLA